MYQDLSQLYGKKLGALDGAIGHVKDFYFDDQSWAIRYLVVETGTWLSARQVLLTPHAFAPRALGQAVEEGTGLQVNLTRKQIEESPSIDTHLPVSRQYEEEYYRYYGWPAYWEGAGMWGASGFPMATLVIPPRTAEDRPLQGHQQRDDVHLRSTKAIAGYRVQATDGPVGSVSSFRAEAWSWGIREVVVETGHWYSGKPVLILPENIQRISYEDSTVFVTLSKQDIEQTMKTDIAQPVVASIGPGDAAD